MQDKQELAEAMSTQLKAMPQARRRRAPSSQARPTGATVRCLLSRVAPARPVSAPLGAAASALERRTADATRRAEVGDRMMPHNLGRGARTALICARDARRRAVPLDLYLVAHVERGKVQAAAPCARRACVITASRTLPAASPRQKCYALRRLRQPDASEHPLQCDKHRMTGRVHRRQGQARG